MKRFSTSGLAAAFGAEEHHGMGMQCMLSDVNCVIHHNTMAHREGRSSKVVFLFLSQKIGATSSRFKIK